jgi:hypothetical protein
VAWDVCRGEDLPNEATLRRLHMDIRKILLTLWWAREVEAGRRAKPLLKTNKCLRDDWINEG